MLLHVHVRDRKKRLKKQKWTPCRHWCCQHQVSIGKELARRGEVGRLFNWRQGSVEGQQFTLYLVRNLNKILL